MKYASMPAADANHFASLDNKSVLITGGTGSLGCALTHALLDRGHVKKLIIFSRDEFKQSEIQQRFESHPRFEILRLFLGDVRDISRVRTALMGVDVVIHTAALKQVPAAEYNPFEFVRTNIHGAENLVRASVECGVERVLALSTDKACAPVNLYGATKLVSDKIFVSANNMFMDMPTRFSVVRYGNVIGSRGSVLPYFQHLMANGISALPITDQRMTRFWITMNQALAFISWCLSTIQGGEIFIPKIQAVAIVTLAQALAPHLPHKIIGLRPGEKLHESLIGVDDAPHVIDYKDCYLILPSYPESQLRQHYLYHGGKEVPDTFSYSSADDDRRLELDQLRDIIRDMC